MPSPSPSSIIITSRLRLLVSQASAGAAAGAAEQAANFDENGSQVMFTMEQVRSILERALEDKEIELSDKYDKLLTDRLQGEELCVAERL